MIGIPPGNAIRDARIIRMRRRGKWPFQIAEALGLSRNTVIGVLNRAGLSSSDTDRGAAIEDKCIPRTVREEIARRVQLRSRECGASALAREYGISAATAWRIATYGPERA